MSAPVYACILAGGSGSRFWPRSRLKTPKQLCKIGSNKTLLENTLARLDGFIPPERRMIVTHCEQLAATRDAVGDQAGIILGEPAMRDTANALALAAFHLKEHAPPDAVMISLHADHVIRGEGFRSALDQAVAAAGDGHMVLIGCQPRYPETGYGYIESGDPIDATLYRVACFHEKPDHETATRYVKDGGYFWNIGIFTWQVATLLEEFEQHLPENYRQLATMQADKSWEAGYAQLPKISIDHGILEKSARVAVIPAHFEWHDVGSWHAVAASFAQDQDSQGNYTGSSDALLIDCNNTVIDGGKKLVAALGVSNIAIVATDDAILVCARDRAQDVKKIVEQLRQDGRGELL